MYAECRVSGFEAFEGDFVFLEIAIFVVFLVHFRDQWRMLFGVHHTPIRKPRMGIQQIGDENQQGDQDVTLHSAVHGRGGRYMCTKWRVIGSGRS